MRPGETELEMVQRHVADGKRHIADQRALIVELEGAGADTEVAETMLANLLDTQALHLQHLERVLKHEGL